MHEPLNHAHADAQTNNIPFVRGGTLVLHAIIGWWGWGRATTPEVVDEACHHSLHASAQGIVTLHGKARQCHQLWGMWKSHRHAVNLTSNHAPVHRVSGLYRECYHCVQLVERVSCCP